MNLRTLCKDDFLGIAVARTVGNGFSLGRWTVDKSGDQIVPHGHMNAHFMCVIAGRYISSAKCESHSQLPLIIYNPPQTFHRDHFAAAPGSFFTISINDGLLNQVDDLRLPQEPTQVNSARASTLMMKLMRACSSTDSDSACLIGSLCSEILATIASPLTERQPPSWLKMACEIIQDRFAEQVSIEELSSEVGVHPIHLARTFRAFYRCTPSEFLRLCRLSKAAELLTSSRFSLSQIAVESGFADQSHLTKSFRQNYGVPPGQYRRQTSSPVAFG